MMRMSVPFSSRWVAKLCRRTCTVTRLVRARPPHRRAAGGMQDLGSIGLIFATAGKEPGRGSRQSPIGAQNAEQLRRQHDVAVLAAFAVLDPDDPCALSMSATLRPLTSEARNPAA